MHGIRPSLLAPGLAWETRHGMAASSLPLPLHSGHLYDKHQHLISPENFSLDVGEHTGKSCSTFIPFFWISDWRSLQLSRIPTAVVLADAFKFACACQDWILAGEGDSPRWPAPRLPLSRYSSHSKFNATFTRKDRLNKELQEVENWQTDFVIFQFGLLLVFHNAPTSWDPWCFDSTKEVGKFFFL